MLFFIFDILSFFIYLFFISLQNTWGVNHVYKYSNKDVYVYVW